VRRRSGAHERGGALELLGGEQPQRVAHEDGDARLTAARVFASADGSLEPPDREGERRQAEVRLGFAATGREEQQVDEGVGVRGALRVGRDGERRDVQKHESELERSPRRGLRALRVHIVQGLGIGQGPAGRGGFVAPRGQRRVPPLIGHRLVGEAERGEGVAAIR
jgi:hypothetical protein